MKIINQNSLVGWVILAVTIPPFVGLFDVCARMIFEDVSALPRSRLPPDPLVAQIIQLGRWTAVPCGNFHNCIVVTQSDVCRNLLQGPPFGRVPRILPPLDLHFTPFGPMAFSLSTPFKPMMSLVKLVLWPLSKFEEVAILASVLDVVLSRPPGHLEPSLAKLLEGLTGFDDSILKHHIPLQMRGA